MTTCRQVEALLSLHVDGLLDARDTSTVHAHLANCPSCRGLLADLQQLTTAARDLGPIDPPGTVWPGLVAGLARAAAPDEAQPTRWPPAWLAAAAALLLVTGGASWLVHRAPADVAVSPSAPATAGSIERVVDDLALASQHYERAIAELQALAPVGNGVDPQLASVVTSSIALLDDAIAESRRALAADPADEPARLSLFEALRRKVELLQATALLIDDVRRTGPDEPGRTGATNGMGREL